MARRHKWLSTLPEREAEGWVCVVNWRFLWGRITHKRSEWMSCVRWGSGGQYLDAPRLVEPTKDGTVSAKNNAN